MAILTFNSAAAGLGGGTFGESFVFAEDSIVTGIFINSTGTKLWMVGSQNDNVYAYTFGTPWDVSTLTYDNDFLDVSSEDGIPTGIWFKSDGTEAYVTGSLGDEINTYTLSTAWDISTGTYSATDSITTNTDNPSRPFFNATGTKMFIVDQSSGAVPDTIDEYSLSIAWDMATLTYVGMWANPTSDFIGGVSFNSTGTKMYIPDTSTDFVYEYNLSVAWDLSTAIQVSALDISTEQSSAGAPFIKTDNSKMIISGQSPSGVFGYDL